MTRTPSAPSGRFGWLRRIESLDPVADRHEIHRITAGHEFPWDYQRSLEFALFRTYCSPRVSAVLKQSGEFEHHPQKRYDDTAILMAEMLDHGMDSDRGQESVRNINRMHGQYDIANEDMLYVLSTFIFDPLDWIDRYGWRRLHPKERLAAFYFYKEIGERMAISDIPDTLPEFQRFKLEYEAREFRYSPDNHDIGTYTLDLFSGWFPRPLRPLVRRGAYAFLGEQMTTAFGFPSGSPRLREFLMAGLRLRARVVRWLPPRRVARVTGDPGNRTYPGYPTGYRPRDLGTPRVSPLAARMSAGSR
ncbi:oxygenase MpaB family protein [Tomitella biformata]|uniref:oxygenase MpaB family protein n=1 Tax=Tomitella biformata TaxID=630403 RepID=UPI000463C333|nr:oxygenase MpaB family protein [Tomitella biformata]